MSQIFFQQSKTKTETLPGIRLILALVFIVLSAAGFAADVASVSLSPSTASFVPGQSRTFTATVTRQANNTFSAAMTASGLPAGFTASFSPSTLNFVQHGANTQASTLTISVASNATVGNYNISITATKVGNSGDSASAALTTTSGIQSQTISMPSISNRTYGDAAFAVSASASSGLPVTLTASGPATVSAGMLTITGVGTVTVTGTQAGNSQYSAATATSTFAVGKGSQTVSLPGLPNMRYGDGPINITATSSTGLPVTLSVSGAANLSGNQLSVTSPGSVTVTATQAGSSLYNSATASASFTVSKAAQTLTMPSIGNISYGQAPMTLNASSSAGLPVTFSISGPATISGNTLSITGVGNVTLTVSQAGTSLYEAVTNSETFTVSKGSQSINFAAIGDHRFGDAPFTVNASSSSGLGMTYSVSGPATLNGPVVTITGIGSVTVTAEQPGNANVNAASLARTFSVSRAAQVISFDQITTLAVGRSAQLNASSSAGLPVTLTLESGPATLVGNTLMATGLGVIVVRASQAGNSVFEAADDVVRTASSLGSQLSGHDDTFQMEAGTILTVSGLGVTKNDEDGLRAKVVLYEPSTVGIIELETNGSFTFIPPLSFVGKISFRYVLVRHNYRSPAITVTIEVLAKLPSSSIQSANIGA